MLLEPYTLKIAKTKEKLQKEEQWNNAKTTQRPYRPNQGGQLVSTRALLLDLFLSCGFRSIIPRLEPPTILAQPLSGKDSKKKKKTTTNSPQADDEVSRFKIYSGRGCSERRS